MQASADDMRRTKAAFGSVPDGAFWSHMLTDEQWRQYVDALNLQRWI